MSALPVSAGEKSVAVHCYENEIFPTLELSVATERLKIFIHGEGTVSEGDFGFGTLAALVIFKWVHKVGYRAHKPKHGVKKESLEYT